MAEYLTINSQHNNTNQGWVPQTSGRGTLDIIYSCSLTILLCCWTSVYPNIPAITDSSWHQFRDKLHLACLGILGPDFLFALSLGQWDSARRSVKVIRNGVAHATVANGFSRYFSQQGTLTGPWPTLSLQIWEASYCDRPISLNSKLTRSNYTTWFHQVIWNTRSSTRQS